MMKMHKRGSPLWSVCNLGDVDMTDDWSQTTCKNCQRKRPPDAGSLPDGVPYSQVHDYYPTEAEALAACDEAAKRNPCPDCGGACCPPCGKVNEAISMVP